MSGESTTNSNRDKRKLVNIIAADIISNGANYNGAIQDWSTKQAKNIENKYGIEQQQEITNAYNLYV